MPSRPAFLRRALACCLLLMVGCQGFVDDAARLASETDPAQPGDRGDEDRDPPGEDRDDNGTTSGTDGGADVPSGTAGGLPCHVESLLNAYCAGCHNNSPVKVAPMPLLTRLDLLAPLPSDPTQTVAAGSLARMRDRTRPMPPAGVLAGEVVDGFASWIESGMPEETCTDDEEPAPLPFEAAPPHAALAKVKGLLTGAAPSAEELATVSSDPNAIKLMIDGYMQTPEFEAKMLRFFATAFQQNDLTTERLQDQLGTRLIGDQATLNKLLLNLQESFARTSLEIVKSGRPFTETVTTQRFVMTTAVLSFLTLLDGRYVDDTLRVSDTATPFEVRTSGSVISLLESLNPLSTNFLKFSALDATNGCATTLRTSSSTAELFQLLLGRTPREGNCNPSAAPPLFVDADFNDWRVVELKPSASLSATRFFELPALRAATSHEIRIPRVGFFSTPAFFANWATNDSNEMRVTTNQTLIVALGASFDGSDSTVPVSEEGISADHAAPGTACYACHKTLDPMRNFFRQAYSFGYHEQRNRTLQGVPASFVFDGFEKAGSGATGLAQALAEHPRFARAWAEKLCFYANSTSCSADDPELLRVASLFRASGFDFKTLVRELFSSPLVTQHASTHTFQGKSPVISIARREHLCAALSTRLGVRDLCGLASPTLTSQQRAAQTIARAISADGFSRGSEIPVTLSDTNLFFRGATESLCASIAPVVVDAPSNSRYRSSAKDAAIVDMVHNVMALAPMDPREPTALEILRAHYNDSIARGAKPTDALRSTFVLACTAPSTVSIGL